VSAKDIASVLLLTTLSSNFASVKGNHDTAFSNSTPASAALSNRGLSLVSRLYDNNAGDPKTASFPSTTFDNS
jgi:hypothetical protein